MKHLARLIAPVLAAVMVLSACTKPAEESPADISEKAMDSFLAKVDAGNYTIDAAGYLKTNVCSNDLVIFDYTDEVHNDFAVMAIDNEVFQGFLTEEGVENVTFLGEGHATDIAESRLINHWTSEEVSEGNIYNLFYNSTEEPLTFVSHDENLKAHVLGLAGYSDAVGRLMHDVYLTFDSEDPTLAHLTCEMDEDRVARIAPDDIDITITFNDAQSDPRADSWISDPAYPAAQTAWNSADYFLFNSVFLTGADVEVIPFPSFASYAMLNDKESFMTNDCIRIRDSRATEKDMSDYANKLIESGFTEVKETDSEGVEKTYYRKLLREEYKCYASVELEYDNGVNITARKYYDFPVYEDVDSINDAITAQGFLPLPVVEGITPVNGVDRAYELIESWLYFFDYDLNLYVNVKYDDYDKAVAYLNDYGKALEEAGFIVPYADDEEATDMYQTRDEQTSFRYIFNMDDTFTMLFRSQRDINAREAKKMIAEAGFPEIDLTDSIVCRDHRKFEKAQYGKDVKASITVSKKFASLSEAEEFLNNYESALTAAGFERVNPSTVGSLKNVAIYNAEKKLLVGIDLFEQENDALVNFDFKAE